MSQIIRFAWLSVPLPTSYPLLCMRWRDKAPKVGPSHVSSPNLTRFYSTLFGMEKTP